MLRTSFHAVAAACGLFAAVGPAAAVDPPQKLGRYKPEDDQKATAPADADTEQIRGGHGGGHGGYGGGHSFGGYGRGYGGYGYGGYGRGYGGYGYGRGYGYGGYGYGRGYYGYGGFGYGGFGYGGFYGGYRPYYGAYYGGYSPYYGLSFGLSYSSPSYYSTPSYYAPSASYYDPYYGASNTSGPALNLTATAPRPGAVVVPASWTPGSTEQATPGNFRYDGGPSNPVPQPKPDGKPIAQPVPQPKADAVKISVPATPAAKPAARYKAYGES